MDDMTMITSTTDSKCQYSLEIEPKESEDFIRGYDFGHRIGYKSGCKETEDKHWKSVFKTVIFSFLVGFGLACIIFIK